MIGMPNVDEKATEVWGQLNAEKPLNHPEIIIRWALTDAYEAGLAVKPATDRTEALERVIETASAVVIHDPPTRQQLTTLSDALDEYADLAAEDSAEREADNPLHARGHDRPCWYCKERCSSLAGNPGLWPLLLPLDSERPGHAVPVHTRCILSRVKRSDDFVAAERERIRKLLADEAVVRIVAATLSVVATHNPNPRRPGEQLPQVPFDEQPDGWRTRCIREAQAICCTLSDHLTDDKRG